jgi:hypothetical protein
MRTEFALPIFRLTIFASKKIEPRYVGIRQYSHRRDAAAQCRHYYFCRALDTLAKQHHPPGIE